MGDQPMGGKVFVNEHAIANHRTRDSSREDRLKIAMILDLTCDIVICDS